MELKICLVLIQIFLIKVILVYSQECDPIPTDYHDFNIDKFLGVWHWLYHTPNYLESDYGCLTDHYGPLTPNNISRMYTEAVVLSEKKKGRQKFPGYVSKWASNNFYNRYEPTGVWDATYYVLGADYAKYIIIRACMRGNEVPSMWVGFRSKNPNTDTINEARNLLVKNNMDLNAFLEYSEC